MTAQPVVILDIRSLSFCAIGKRAFVVVVDYDRVFEDFAPSNVFTTSSEYGIIRFANRLPNTLDRGFGRSYSSFFPEPSYLEETLTNRSPDRKMIRALPALTTPVFAEIRNALWTVPIETNDIGGWIVRKRRLCQPLNRCELLGWTGTE